MEVRCPRARRSRTFDALGPGRGQALSTRQDQRRRWARWGRLTIIPHRGAPVRAGCSSIPGAMPVLIRPGD